MSANSTATPLSATEENQPQREDEASRQQRLGEEKEAELHALLHDLKTLPSEPDIHSYGSTIEFVKNILAVVTKHIGDLKEVAAAFKDVHTKSVRGDKATLNEKDKQEVARLCAEDQSLQSVEQLIAQLQDGWTRWDARRSRLSRDFEIAKTDYANQRAMALLDAQVRHDDERLNAQRATYREVADYAVNKLRNAL